MNKPNIFFRLKKIDEAKRLVTGIATAEVPDKVGEICDYEGTKPFYKAWSDTFRKNTNGASLGNLRAMHEPIAAGKIVDIQYDDIRKEIEITAKVVDDDCWNKCLEAVFTGFSQGGEYVKKWKDGAYQRYIADPSEVSLVDSPCLAAATIEIVKADGSIVMQKLKSQEPNTMTVEQGWKAADGSFHKSKSEAMKKNAQIEADAEVAKVLGDTLAAVGAASDRLDKREFTQDERDHAAATGAAMPDGSFPIHNATDLENAVHAFGRAKDKDKAKAHIIERAKAIGATDKLPADWEGSTQKTPAEKAEKRAMMKTLAKDSTFDAAQAMQALDTIEWLLEHEAGEAADGEDETGQVADLEAVIERLKTFIASEITEDLRDDGTLERVLGANIMKGSAMHKEHAEDVGKMHKGAMTIMEHVQKCMMGPGGVKKAEHHTAEDHQHVEKIHGEAVGIADKCMKMSADQEPPMAAESQQNVHEIHKSATNVMDACHKFMKGADMVGKAEHHDDHDVAQLHKMHGHAQDIADKCVKMFGEGKPSTGDGEDQPITKLAKAEALNTSLTKAMGDLQGTVTNLLGRIDHLEKQPAVRKGALFAVDRSNEAQSGQESVETAKGPINLNPLRLSPEDMRRMGGTIS